MDRATRAPRHIAITGASAGLGKALALTYARPGVVLCLGARDADRLHASASQCRDRGAIVLAETVNVRDAAATQQWLVRFDAQYAIDLVIANAGASSTLSSTSDWESREVTTAIVDTNFLGAMHTVLPVIERMRSRGGGQVALISSIAALRGMAISPAYCASKAALKAWGDSVRPLLARDGIALSVVLPGFVQTAMSDAFPGNKPLQWSADKAANHIQRALAARRAEIAFPGLLAFGTRLLPLLPAGLADAILTRLSYVPRNDR